MTRLIWPVSIAAISWTVLNRLFIISNNERSRPSRSRRLPRGGPHQKFPARGAGRAYLGLEPEPAASRHGAAAGCQAVQPHHALPFLDRSRRDPAGARWTG